MRSQEQTFRGIVDIKWLRFSKLYVQHTCVQFVPIVDLRSHTAQDVVSAMSLHQSYSDSGEEKGGVPPATAEEKGVSVGYPKYDDFLYTVITYLGKNTSN